jgi:hypothetical protein
LIGSTNGWSVSSEQPISRQSADNPLDTPQIVPPPKRRRFSADTANDLLFWGFHLCIVAISLAIVWTKIEATNDALRKLLLAQQEELVLVRQQAQVAEEQAMKAQEKERTRAIQLTAATKIMDGVLERVNRIQDDITSSLEQGHTISQSVLAISHTVLDASNQSHAASIQAVNAADTAANAAAAARNAAGVAASQSSAAKAMVRSKVVTTQDKIRIQQEEAALAAKRQQLQKTIKQVKKNGPNWFQRTFQ